MDYEKFFGDGRFSELMVENIIKCQLTDGGVLLDGGANEGRHTMVGLKAGGEVYAVEPIPQMVEKIRAAAAADLPRPERLKILQFALSDQEGEAEFTFCPNRSTLSGLHSRARLKDEETEKITVSKITIDRLIERFGLRQPSVIKLDLEGGEHDALMGATATLRNRPVIVFEHGGTEGANIYRYSNDDYYRFFGSMGYRLLQINGQECRLDDFLRPRHWYFVAIHEDNPTHRKLMEAFDYLFADASQRMLVENKVRTSL